MENPDYQRQLLRDVFGESSDSEEEAVGLSSSTQSQSTNAEHGLLLFASVSNPSRSWHRIETIDGLWLCNDFLPLQQQALLLSSIQNEGWFTELSHNQAMRFGDLPFWAVELSDHIHKAICVGNRGSDIGMSNLNNETCILPSELLWRDPFFDQLIVNVYQPGHLCTC